MAIRRIIGIAGVAPEQPYRAQLWGRRFDIAMLLIAVWLVGIWYLDTNKLITPMWRQITSWTVWGFFVLETLSLLILVDDRLRYLKRNWVNWVIIIVGFPLIWIHTPYVALLRLLRVLVVIRLLIPFWDLAVRVLARNKLGTTLLISLAVTVVSGVVISLIDPKIGSITDGIWYAWETVTTVGYGDIVPDTLAGRLFGSFLILMGIIIISLLTANFSAYIIGKGVKKAQKETKDEEVAIKGMLLAIQNKLDQMDSRIQRVEGEMASEEPLAERN